VICTPTLISPLVGLTITQLSLLSSANGALQLAPAASTRHA
jgi:hypothetical protein